LEQNELNQTIKLVGFTILCKKEANVSFLY